MEGVGARLGRSSSRYGTTTVFSGPVRKWTKKWVPITPPPPSSSSSSFHHHTHNSNHHSNSNGSTPSNTSHLRLFKWTPLSKHSNTNNSNSPDDSSKKIKSNGSPTDNGSPAKDDDDTLSHEPLRRKFKFIPIAVLEEQKKEYEENSDGEAKPVEADEENEEQVTKVDIDEKPDINDVPMEENQDSEGNQTAPARQDLNELDLSLGVTSNEE